MKKILISLALFSAIVLAFNSCSGCVKKATKSVTEAGLSAVEGVAEAVNENGERIGKLTTDAAGSIALGVGKSLSEQLDAHASKVASVTGRTLVQSVDGLMDGISEEAKTHYNVVPHSEELASGVKLDYIAKYKHASVVDAYFIFSENSAYTCKFDCYDKDGNIFLTKEIVAEKSEGDTNKYTMISFAMDRTETQKFEDLKEIKVTVTK